MEGTEVDPYEQQLRAVFDSCDVDHEGSLDQAGLLQLCNTLQLDEDQAEQLLNYIDITGARVSFPQFRDGLVKLLNGSSDVKDGDCVRLSLGRGDSPEREVSPKLVLGQKKYGRRSRPESSEHDVDLELVQKLDGGDFKHTSKDITDDSRLIADSPLSPDDDLKSHKDIGFISSDGSAWPACIEQEDELMRSLLERLEVGKDGYLDQSELTLVCEYIRTEKYVIDMVQQLDGPINLEEFLSIIRRCSRKSTPETLTDRNPNNPASLVMIDCNGEGMASPESIVELWEAAGISHASQLLRDLGLDDGAHPLNVTSLAALLEEELRGREDGSGLLQAALALRQAELRWLRSSMEQMICERDKLRNDLAEANHRANILAQEVDEHHAKLEKLSQDQVRLLEHKHAEALRELTKEKESLAQHAARLEREIASLQLLDTKQAAELVTLREKNENLERETRSLAEQISEGEGEKKRMERELAGKTQLLQRISELESNREQDQVQPLLERLSLLQSENSSLRDRNDELAVELEALSRQFANVSVRRQSSSDTSVCGAIKRRGNSPLELTAPDDSGDEESPRLGKVRRCSDRQEVSLAAAHMEGLQINSLARGDNVSNADDDGCDDSETLSAGSFERLDDSWLKTPGQIHSDGDILGEDGCYASEVSRLQARVAELEQVLKERPVCKAVETQTAEEEVPGRGPAVEKLQRQCRDLEFQLDNVKVEVMKILSEKRACSQENCILKERVSDLSTRLANSAAEDEKAASASADLEMQAELQTERAQSAALREKVSDLEQSLEMMEREYERCEEYWSSKLEEERQIVEREQRATDEKFVELLEKIQEFEQLAAQQNSLATIEEHAGLEQEVTELQDEVRELRRIAEETEHIQQLEIQKLRGEVDRLQRLIPECRGPAVNVAVQTMDADNRHVWNNERHHSVSSGDSYTTDSSASGASCPQDDPSTSSSSSSAGSRSHRRRLHASSGSVTDKRHRFGRGRGESLRQQPKAYSQLHLSLRQQCSQAHALLQHQWSQHREEITELEKQIALCKEHEQKLAQADILVTELYVENSRLWTTIQTMQSQLHRACRTQEDLCRH